MASFGYSATCNAVVVVDCPPRNHWDLSFGRYRLQAVANFDKWDCQAFLLPVFAFASQGVGWLAHSASCHLASSLKPLAAVQVEKSIMQPYLQSSQLHARPLQWRDVSWLTRKLPTSAAANAAIRNGAVRRHAIKRPRVPLRLTNKKGRPREGRGGREGNTERLGRPGNDWPSKLQA